MRAPLLYIVNTMRSRYGLLLKLDGLIPSKKNSRITHRATGRSFPSPAYRRWQIDAFNQLLAQFGGRWDKDPNIQKCRLVRIHFFFGTKRRADLSNKAESVMDLLVDAGVLADDNWRVVPRLSLSGSYRKNLDGALVRIVE